MREVLLCREALIEQVFFVLEGSGAGDRGRGGLCLRYDVMRDSLGVDFDLGVGKR